VRRQLPTGIAVKKGHSSCRAFWYIALNSIFWAIETSVMKTVSEQTTQTAEAQELALAQLIVQTLNLEVAASSIDARAPLFGEGLGLDSIDMLEIALAVSQTYGVKLRADDTENNEIFRSLASLNRHIQQHRA
jgi:acyl carrier protein